MRPEDPPPGCFWQAVGRPITSEQLDRARSCPTTIPSPTPWRSRHRPAPARPQVARFRAGSTASTDKRGAAASARGLSLAALRPAGEQRPGEPGKT